MAVIGIGCRFAGAADSPEDLWDLFLEAPCTSGEEAAGACSCAPPPDRPDRPDVGTQLGPAPHQALVEAARRALGDAGIAADEPARSESGVFLGAGAGTWSRTSGRQQLERESTAAWAAAEALAETLGMSGPVLAVGPAPAASLAALDLACQNIRSAECPLALVAGADLTVRPPSAPPPSGAPAAYRGSDTFAVLVLKALALARRDGDRVFAVVRSSSVNQDRRDYGSAAPSEEAQEYVLRQSFRAAGLSPETIDYVEAHGAGARIGSVLGAGPLRSILGTPRPTGQPCLVGSDGVLGTGSGIASIVKVVLALVHGEIPAGTHGTSADGLPRRQGTGLRAVTGRVLWPRRTHPRRAGVAGFGADGMIAHIVLEEGGAAARGGIPHLAPHGTVPRGDARPVPPAEWPWP